MQPQKKTAAPAKATKKAPAESAAESGVPALIDKKVCIQCGTCFGNCPVKAIGLEVVGDANVYTVDPSKCISCGTCIKNCPVQAINWTKADAKKPATDSTKVPKK